METTDKLAPNGQLSAYNGLASALLRDGVRPELVERQVLFLHNRKQIGDATVMSNLLSFACPINPISFLSAFMAFDKLGGGDRSPLEQFNAQSKTHRLAMLAAADAAVREAKRRGGSDKGLLSILCERQNIHLDNVPVLSGCQSLTGMVKERKTSFSQPGRFASEKLAQKMFLTRDKQIKLAKLKKRKMLLEGFLERQNKLQDFVAMSKVSSQLDLLDKALKRLQSE